MALKWFAILVLFLFAGSLLWGQSGSSFLITTVAGNGTVGYSGDGGPATSATLHSPGPVAADSFGNLYIGDLNNLRVRKANPAGVITTIAGNGIAGYSGDGGPATSAEISGQTGLAVDASGNLYIADYFNMRVRKVTPSGTITTVAGNGNKGFSGDGGPATSASLYAPSAVAIDGLGNLFIADSDNYRVRKVTPAGIITTVAGNGVQGSSGDGGPATNAALWPAAVTMDASNNLYILDEGGSGAGALRKVTPAGIITTLFRWSVPSGLLVGGGPTSIAVDPSGDVYAAVSFENLVQKVTPSGAITTVAGNGTQGFSGDGGPATSASLYSPAGVAVSATGNVFFSDDGNQRVRELVAAQPTNGCLYSLDKQSQSFGPSGGNGTVAVLTSEAGCGWLISSNGAWITITSSSSGTGSSVVSYSVAPNTNSASRTGLLTIAGDVFSISQSGVQCSVAINPSSVAVPPEGQIGGLVTVTANAPDCTWTVQNNYSWILISSGTVGAGDGTVTYTVGPNVGGYRTATVNIAGQTFWVNQAPPGTSIDTIATITNGGVVNSASSESPISPGSFVTIYGTNFTDGSSPSWGSAINGIKLPTTLGGVTVSIGNNPCFVSFVSPTQINVLTPPDSGTGSTSVIVATNYGTAVGTAVMTQLSPAFFTYVAQGKFYLAALFANEDVLVGSPGVIPGAASAPAQPGDYIALYANGLGMTNPAYPVGQVLTQPYPIADPSSVSVTVGGQPAAIQFAGMTLPGVFQVNIQVPAGVPSGDLPVVLQIGGQSTQPNAFLTFQN